MSKQTPTLEQYRDLIDAAARETAEYRGRTLEPARAREAAARDLSDHKSEAVRTEQRNRDLRAATRPLLPAIIGFALCGVILAYYVARSLTAHAQSDRKWNICIFFGALMVGFVLFGVARVLYKKKKLARADTLIASLREEEAAAREKSEAATKVREEAEEGLLALEARERELREALARDYPAEREREEREREDALRARLCAQKEKEAAYDAMVADTEARKEQLALAEEMFDSPRKFIGRDKYGSELEVLRACAEMGNEEAMARLINLYAGADFLTGVEPDRAEALALAEKYAGGQDGSPLAAEAMGEIYLFGKGCFEKDSERAVKWLSRAANRGRKNAMVNLGYCYYAGDGAAQDIERAKYWFDKAARQGDDQAFRMLEAIEQGRSIRVD